MLLDKDQLQAACSEEPEESASLQQASDTKDAAMGGTDRVKEDGWATTVLVLLSRISSLDPARADDWVQVQSQARALLVVPPCHALAEFWVRRRPQSVTRC